MDAICCSGNATERAVPRFAVLLCTHEGERFLPAQLASLAQQTQAPVAVFVHDWASRDGTRTLLEAARDAAPSGQRWDLHWHAEAPGPARSFLAAIEPCLDAGVAFDYLCFCDQDDVWSQAKIAALAEAAAADGGCDLVHADVRVVDAEGRMLRANQFAAGGVYGVPMDVAHPSALWVNTIAGMSMAVSRRLLTQVRAAWSLPGWLMHDWAVVAVAHLLGARVCFVPQVLVDYRQHGANAIGSAARGIGPALRRPRAYVRAVARQYAACMRLRAEVGRPLVWPGRLWVARSVAASPSLPRWRAWRAALGFLLLWPRCPPA